MDGDRSATEFPVKSRSKHALVHVALGMAILGMAAVGFDFIIETLTERTVGFQRAFGHRAPTPVPSGR